MANRTARQQYKRKLDSIATTLDALVLRVAEIGIAYKDAKPDMSQQLFMICEALEALTDATKEINREL